MVSFRCFSKSSRSPIPRPLVLAALLLLAAAPFLAVSPLAAQTDMPTAPVLSTGPVPVADASALKQPTSMDKGWLVQVGDSPAWSDPNFDDSKWPRFNAKTDSLRVLFPHNHPDVVWYRIHIKVSPEDKQLAVLEYYTGAAFELFSNGESLLKLGSVRPFQPYESSAYLLRPIPAAQIATGSLVIAVRCHVSSGEWTNAYPGLYYYNLIFGQQSVLHDLMWLRVIGTRGLGILNQLLNLAMLAGAILLYTAQRRREYFFLALVYAVSALVLPLNLYTAFHTYPNWWHAINCVVSLFTPWLFCSMYMAFVGRPVGWRMNLLAIVAGICSCIEAILGFMLIENSVTQFFLLIPLITLSAVVLPWALIREMRRGNRDAGILVVPLLLSMAYQLLVMCFFALSQIPSLREWAWFTNGQISAIYAGPITISWQVVAEILSTLSLALIILRRSNRVSQQQALLEGELANAREVQRVIVPEATASNPGFHVESVYEPATEVGGDFFQVLDDNAGGLFVVVGDVAGKGLPAAMLVSVLVGSIRSVAAYTNDPAEMLAQLNQRLQGRTNGGFSTAIAAHISANGTVKIANAGHLSPYLDGRELDLPGALPLGIDGKAAYETSTITLPAGSRLTFLSDGVPEAQSATGELFGFDRAKEISTASAGKIAQAAKDFGQSDDITVVAIARAAAIATAA